MLTKNAVGNLINRYKAVLTNCCLMNMFGSLALAAGLVTGVTGAAMGLTLAGVSDAMADEVRPTITNWDESDYTLQEFGTVSQVQGVGIAQVISSVHGMEILAGAVQQNMFGMVLQGIGHEASLVRKNSQASGNNSKVLVLSSDDENKASPNGLLTSKVTDSTYEGGNLYEEGVEEEVEEEVDVETEVETQPEVETEVGTKVEPKEDPSEEGDEEAPVVPSWIPTPDDLYRMSFKDTEASIFIPNGGADPAVGQDTVISEIVKTVGGKVEGVLQKAVTQQGVPADGVVPAPNGSDSLDLKNDSFIIKDANSYNTYSTASMYADASNDSGTFSDMGTSRSYMSPTDAVWSAFISPFYGKSGMNNGDVQSNMVGLNMGATRFLNDQTLFGFSASISRAKGDADGADSSATNYAVGMHAMYMFNDSAYIRGQITGMFGQSDYDFQKDLYGQRFAADADMDSYGLYAQMAVGYSFVFGHSGGADSGTTSAKTQGAQHTVRPELALSYFYNHMDGYSAEYYDGPLPTGYGFSVRSEDYDALYTDLTVRWTGAFGLGQGKDYGLFKPTVKLGVRQALTDPEVSSTMDMLGLSTVSHTDLNETAFLCEAGVAWEMDEVTLSATYSGEFGDVQYSHSGMLMVEWEF